MRPHENLDLEDNFYGVLKILNFGLPTLAYGISGLLMATYTESLKVNKYSIVKNTDI